MNHSLRMAIRTAYFADGEFAGESVFLAEAYLTGNDVDVWYIWEDGSFHQLDPQ